MSGAENEQIDQDSIEKEMRTIVKETLEKHLMGRKFDKDNVKKWGNLIIDEIHKAVSNKFPEYGYVIFFYMSDITAFVSNVRAIYYKRTDIEFLEKYHTDDFYCITRLFATKINGQMYNFLNIAKDKEVSSTINQKLSAHLEGRAYDHELFIKLINMILEDINNLLLERDNKPCSYIIGYFNKHPIKGIYFYYKFFNLKLYPILFNYETDSFTCRIYLFLINN